MSSFPKSDKSVSEDFAWRVAGYFAETGSPPSLEISAELEKEFAAIEYIPGIGEMLIELGVHLLKYNEDSFEEEEPRRPSPRPRPAKAKNVPTPKPATYETGGYL